MYVKDNKQEKLHLAHTLWFQTNSFSAQFSQ